MMADGWSLMLFSYLSDVLNREDTKWKKCTIHNLAGKGWSKILTAF